MSPCRHVASRPAAIPAPGGAPSGTGPSPGVEASPCCLPKAVYTSQVFLCTPDMFASFASPWGPVRAQAQMQGGADTQPASPARDGRGDAIRQAEVNQKQNRLLTPSFMQTARSLYRSHRSGVPKAASSGHVHLAPLQRQCVWEVTT